MNVATITIPEEKARDYFEQYRDSVREARHEERVEEDRMMMRAFKAADQGLPLLHLTDSMRTAGEDELHRPRLAIARAHVEWAHLERRREGGFTIAEDRWPAPNARFSIRRFADGTLPEGPWIGSGTWRAMVPNIPPKLRPKFKLGNYHVLWEAEWLRIREVRAPRDPFLLKWLGGELYAVLAAWDLTEIERAVLADHRLRDARS